MRYHVSMIETQKQDIYRLPFTGFLLAERYREVPNSRETH